MKLFILKKNKNMRNYIGIGQISSEDKQDILNQHKSLYNGYQTLQPNVSNKQPLTVYDFAGDKDGFVVNNKGEVKKYTNVGINEQVETKEVCDECGSMMMEGECTECGWKGDMGEETGHLDDIYNVKDLNNKSKFDYVEEQESNSDEIKKIRRKDVIEDLIKNEYGEEIVSQYVDIKDYDDDFNDEEDDKDDDFMFETMKSAWDDEELDENDISDSQGIYGDMKKPYDFDSEGPGKAGPYQHSESNGETREGFMYDDVDEDNPDDLEQYKDEWEGIMWDDDVEYEDLDGGWEEIDEDLKESFTQQKNKITEMMNRMKIIK